MIFTLPETPAERDDKMTAKKTDEAKPKFDYVIDCERDVIHPATGKFWPDETGKPITVGFIIGAILSEEHSDFIKPMKAWTLSQKLLQGKKLGVDTEDLTNIKKTLENTKHRLAFPFVVGQVMEYLEGLKRE